MRHEEGGLQALYKRIMSCLSERAPSLNRFLYVKMPHSIESTDGAAEVDGQEQKRGLTCSSAL